LLTAAGDQVPVIPLSEVVGSTGAADPLQMAATAAKVGVICAFTVTDSMLVFAHCPAAGVKVYVPEVVLLTVAGNHVPVIPLREVVGSTGAADPLQIGATAAKVGVT
jgi:hypothetical protein